MIRSVLLWAAFAAMPYGCPIALAAPAQQPAQQPAKPGSFDHIRILVHDIAAARIAYRDGLGFAFPDPEPYVYDEGSAHDGTDLPDDFYLELIGIANREKLVQVRPWIVSFLDSTEGAHSIGLLVPSAAETAKRLQSQGIEAPIFKLARANPQDPPVLLVTPKMPHLPEGAIFFLEYPPKRASTKPEAPPAPQPNTVKAIVAIWIVVNDLDRSSEDLRTLGFSPGGSFRYAKLGAQAREFRSGRSRIVLLQANAGGLAAHFASTRGQGLLGMTLEVADLQKATALVEEHTQRCFPTYRGRYGRSFFIPPELAAGAWIEMVQKSRK